MLIAHRLFTFADADEIIVLSNGKIVERGTHRQLLRETVLYAQIWKRQSSGFNGTSDNDRLMSDSVETFN